MPNWLLSKDGLALPESWIVGSTTRAVDRYAPAVEMIRLDKRVFPEMSMKINFDGQYTSRKIPRGRIHILSNILSKSKEILLDNEILCDLRFNAPENWAHSIFYHIPLACKILDTMKEDITFILPNLENKNIIFLYNLFGIKIILTDDVVIGKFIEIDINKIEILSIARREWIISYLPKIYRHIDTNFLDNSFSKKIFVNRRDNRRLIGLEVRDYLVGIDYTEVFLEDFDCSKQLAILDKATHVVGIHGAGLAPLLYNRSVAGTKKMVGLMPPLQVTAGFRVLCALTGIKWVGVRGQITPNLAKATLVSSPLSSATSYSDFSVCVDSVARALEICDADI